MEVTRMSRTEKAVTLYKQSFNCSQSVFTAFRDESRLGEETALKLSTVFGAGVSATGTSLCGAVTGALLAISMKHGQAGASGPAQRAELYAMGKSFMDQFAKVNGSCTCSEILGINIGTPANMQKARDMKLFETKCLDAVKTASELLEKIL
jgi:C_GCAxxG_C_C family probable redox protein